jgi:hypothetical protein
MLLPKGMQLTPEIESSYFTIVNFTTYRHPNYFILQNHVKFIDSMFQSIILENPSFARGTENNISRFN